MDILNHIGETIASDIQRTIDPLALHYRLHWRVKEIDSLKNKIQSKGYYSKEGKKVQDIIGFRITTYFYDDVKLLWNVFKQVFDVVDEEYDQEKTDVFGILRKNMVCAMPKHLAQLHTELATSDKTYILTDHTFEIQFRTTFSEGWHEIDHALRYKCKDDWAQYPEEERYFNGIFAALESNDRMLKSLFDDLAYNHYKNNNWEAMMRTKFRLHFQKTKFSLMQYIQEDHSLAKIILRCSRDKILLTMAKYKSYIPMTFDNLFWFIIYIEAPEHYIMKSIPSVFFNEWNMRIGNLHHDNGTK